MSTISLIHIIVALGLYLYTLNHVDPVGMVPIICKMRYYIVQSTGMMYRWFLTVACFDRFTLSVVDVGLRNFANVKIARRMVMGLTLIWLVLPIHVPIVYNIRGNICGIFDNIAASLYHSAFECIFGSILPILVMATCTLLVHRNLALKRQRCQRNAPKAKEVEKIRSKRDQQVLIMLLVQMMFYVVTIVPLLSIYFYNALTIYVVKPMSRIIIERFCSFLSEMINFLFPVCSFYLYTMASRMFRVELKTMLCSLVKYQPSENNTGVELAAHDMKVRPAPERLVPSMPIALNLKKATRY